MKLDIEALVFEAGFWTLSEDKKPLFEAFSRLIVERCAQECVKERNTWAEYSYGYAALLDFEQRLRNLMED